MIVLLTAAVIAASNPAFEKWRSDNGMPDPACRLDAMAQKAAWYESVGDTNRAGRIRRSMIARIRMKSSRDGASYGPVDAFHDFASGRRRIELPKDTRPKDYDKALPEQKDKPPRKK